MENFRILVVDDEPEFSQALKAILAARSHQVLTVSNRDQAERAVREQPTDLVVLGTIMPRGEAFDFHQWLKRTPKFAGLPILVIDAPPERRLVNGWLRDEGMQCEADDFMAKPLTVSAVVPRIERLLSKVARRIRVLVADDHGVVRDGIRALLTLQRDMEVVGEAVNGREALEKTIQLEPDVVLMDIVMPEMNGLEATNQICRQCRRTKVLVLTQHDDAENVLASSQVGALGFIPKTLASSQILAGIRTVSQGKRFAPVISPN